tara:strand:+ start:2915 stop:3343 length:429 start_codon:yes stop_codon:yes gene_type:complete
MFLPYSKDELDEFVTPSGEVFYTFRSIVFDSWLIWDDALPDVLEQRELLDADIYNNIISLASSLQTFHQGLPDYRPLTSTPFNVTRWWDPTERDERWNQGKACLFALKDYTATDLVRLIQKRTELAVTPISRRYVEAYLPDE